MSLQLLMVFSLSIGIAAIIGIVRFRKISPVYYPFLIVVWLAIANEILCDILAFHGYHTIVFIEIFSLIEAVFYTWLFRNWGLYRRPRWLFPLIMATLVVLWLVETIFIGKFRASISYYRIFYSLFIAVMSIYEINVQINSEKKSLLKNSTFLICITFAVYYTFTVIVGLIWLYGLRMSVAFQAGVVAILQYLNLFANLTYALAVLWMPSKHRFSLPY